MKTEPSLVDTQPNLYNATVDILERNLAPGKGGRPYLITEERTWSYEEVSRTADAVGAGLLDSGLAQGDRIILATGDRPEFVVTFWGAIKAGIVPVPVAQGLGSSDFHFLFKDSGAKAALFDSSSAPAVLPAAEGAGVTAYFAESGPSSATPWTDLTSAGALMGPAPTTRGDVALWLYTSGTTGLPKAVMHRHATLLAGTKGLAKQVIGMTEDDTILSVSKMFFAYGLGNSVYQPAAYGSAVVVHGGPAVPGQVHELIARTRPTVLLGVPAFFNGLINVAGDLEDSIRIVLSAGEALRPQLLSRFIERFGRPLIDGLGATEALHHVTSNRPDDIVPGSAGRPLDGYMVKVLDRDEQPVGDGMSGEMWVKGPTTFIGYWERPDLTARAYRGEWMRTGDLIYMQDGRVYHQGRLDDLIKLGGVWVAPVEIEDVLRSHDDVADAAVVAADTGTGVPVLKAFVTSARSDKPLKKELSDLCRARLARFKVPVSFEIVEELPRTAAGKLKRFVLRGRED